MSNLAKLEFVALNISGKNYLSWVLDVEIHLDALNLGNTIKEALIFLPHHIDEGLKGEYLTMKDPFILWNNLREQHDHQKTIILPKVRYDWIHLKLQDFKYISVDPHFSHAFSLNGRDSLLLVKK